MGQPAEKQRRATYADLGAVPPNKVAELVRGTLHVFPRPAPRHASAESALQGSSSVPSSGGGVGQVAGASLSNPSSTSPIRTRRGRSTCFVPDLAGWRAERMPELPKTAYFALAPDWICEVLSASTENVDRDEKMPIYAREGVRYAWLVDPIARTLEAHVLDADRRWGPAAVYRDAARVRVVPFEAIELDLSVLWAE